MAGQSVADPAPPPSTGHPLWILAGKLSLAALLLLALSSLAAFVSLIVPGFGNWFVAIGLVALLGWSLRHPHTRLLAFSPQSGRVMLSIFLALFVLTAIAPKAALRTKDGVSSPTLKKNPKSSEVATAKQASPTAVREASPEPAADFVYRVGKHWNRDIAELPTIPPNTEDQWNKVLPSIEVLAQNAAEGERLTFTPAQRKIVSTFIERLSAKQTQTLPMLRRHVAERLRANWFRLNIEVRAIGRDAQTLQLMGPMFADNANIEDVQQDIGQTLRQTRFRRVEYRWTRYSGARFYAYALDAPADDQIAYWDGAAGGFHIVKLR